jgi:hypothetical protein
MDTDKYRGFSADALDGETPLAKAHRFRKMATLFARVILQFFLPIYVHQCLSVARISMFFSLRPPRLRGEPVLN